MTVPAQRGEQVVATSESQINYNLLSKKFRKKLVSFTILPGKAKHQCLYLSSAVILS